MTSRRKRTALYRMYDTAGDLLYVGISDDFGYRWKQHATAQPWWPEVHRQTVEWHEDRAGAAASEVTAIKAEKPKYNIRHAAISTPVTAPSRPGDGQIRSNEVRLHFRRLVSAIAHDGEHITVLRYGKPAAVVVPVEWYEKANAEQEEGQP